MFAASLRKECYCKQIRTCFAVTVNFEKYGRFSSRDEVFIWKILPRLCRDPDLNKRKQDRPSRGGRQNVPASYKRNNTFVKK